MRWDYKSAPASLDPFFRENRLSKTYLRRWKQIEIIHSFNNYEWTAFNGRKPCPIETVSRKLCLKFKSLIKNKSSSGILGYGEKIFQVYSEYTPRSEFTETLTPGSHAENEGWKWRSSVHLVNGSLKFAGYPAIFRDRWGQDATDISSSELPQ